MKRFSEDCGLLLLVAAAAASCCDERDRDVAEMRLETRRIHAQFPSAQMVAGLAKACLRGDLDDDGADEEDGAAAAAALAADGVGGKREHAADFGGYGGNRVVACWETNVAFVASD